MKKIIRKLTFYFLILITGCVVRPSFVVLKEPFTNQLPSSICAGSFDIFAFTTPDIEADPQDYFLPMPPWEIEDSIPAQENAFGYHVEAITYYGEQKQIWIRAGMMNPNHLVQGSISENYWVYQPNSRQWKSVSTRLKGSSLIVDKVFLIGDTLWGRISSNPVDDEGKSFPVLARFDLEENLFYPAKNSELPSIKANSQVVFVFPYQNDSVIIVREQDAIYTYKIISQKIERIIDISHLGQIFEPVLSPKGKLFIKRMETAGVINKNGLLVFDVNYGDLNIIQLPYQRIPLAGSLYLDSNHRLWTGIFGWFDQELKWHSFHPEIGQYLNVDKTMALWRYFLPPSVIFESSDGRLWFSIPKNPGTINLRSGMAWFDPKTKDGCWFSSEGTRLVEDRDKILWMVANKSLYFLPLEP